MSWYPYAFADNDGLSSDMIALRTVDPLFYRAYVKYLVKKMKN